MLHFQWSRKSYDAIRDMNVNVHIYSLRLCNAFLGAALCVMIAARILRGGN